MNPISSKLNWKYQKNKHLIESLIFRNAPEFVYKSDPNPLEGEIPVFTFHTALPEWFEQQCMFLVENGYRTLEAEEFLSILKSSGRPIKKSVVLTFDDGLKHVWTVAYPLLRKYGLKATCFLIPGCIPENDAAVRPNLEDYWGNRAKLEEIVSLGHGDSAMATWAEIKVMHESGVVDFQSHTMYHSLVFTSNKIFDFVNPYYDTYYYGNIHIPMYSSDNKDITSRTPIMGMPIFFAQPRMVANRRFFDDEEIRNSCIETVKSYGNEYFFKTKNWRRILCKLVKDLRRTKTVNERYETLQERDKAIFEELLLSKRSIEAKLTGKRVTHLCYPWYDAKAFAVKASKKANFDVNYFGVLRDRPTNRPGDDPFRVVRIEHFFLQRLPGKGRKKLIELIRKTFYCTTKP